MSGLEFRVSGLLYECPPKHFCYEPGSKALNLVFRAYRLSGLHVAWFGDLGLGLEPCVASLGRVHVPMNEIHMHEAHFKSKHMI